MDTASTTSTSVESLTRSTRTSIPGNSTASTVLLATPGNTLPKRSPVPLADLGIHGTAARANFEEPHHPVVTCINQPKTLPSLPEVSSIATAGFHCQEVFVQARQGPPSRRAIFARLHDHPAGLHTRHVYIAAGVQLVERREHRLIGNGSDQANQVLLVRTGGKKALRGWQLIERARLGPAVDRTVPQAPQQHESRELGKVFHDLRLDQVDRIGHAEGAELGTQRFRGSLPWYVQAVQPFLPRLLRITHRNSMPYGRRRGDRRIRLCWRTRRCGSRNCGQSQFQRVPSPGTSTGSSRRRWAIRGGVVLRRRRR
ncbi:hypothetical protein SUDANB9_07770 [Streptomyces sp. enrichment culture]